MRKSFGALATITILLTAAFASPSLADSKGVANENAVGYWTDARMKSALALELVVDPKTKIGVVRSQLPSPNIVPVDQSDWGSKGGLPQTAVGKVYFTMNNTDYVCSGSLVSDDSNLSMALVVTAGHCVISKGKFAKNWMFIPNFDSFGTLASVPVDQRWYATNLVVRSEFANSMQFNKTAVQHDWAFAVIKQGTFIKDGISRNNPGTTLPDSGTNSFGFIPENPGFPTNSNSTAFGYPQADPYNGLSLKFAWGLIIADTSMSTWGMPSYLTGGASGGPWLKLPTSDPSNQTGSYSSTGTVASINSYKYTNDTTNMYGPRFNQKTTATRMAAMDNTCIRKSFPYCVSNLVVSGASATSATGYSVTLK